ncbi:MAG: Na(+)-translocating NADH-quinone reductase subunit A [Calditrichia bacterium]
MGLIKIKKGLDIPISGSPEQTISDAKETTRVALIGDDYVGMKPTMAVAVGERVKLGQLLFTDKKTPGVKYTSPGCGKVVEINRGAKRHFQSIVIELDGKEEVTFPSYDESKLASLSRSDIVNQLLDSGLWTALRMRPFSKVANPETTPHSIFVTAMDTNPLAPSVEKIIEGNEPHFLNGLSLISRLTDGKVFLCRAPGAKIPTNGLANVSVEEFAGPHPAGNVGTHIHFLDPVHSKKTVWYINAQDVIAIGYLFTTGKIRVERVLSLAGPAVKRPRLVKTRMGAALVDVVAGELKEGDNRVISGSVLTGRAAQGPYGYLGRYHQQISVVPEEHRREFLGWLKPGMNLFSVKKILISSLFPHKKFDFTTSLNGALRAIVPVGSYEKVMPLDIIPTYLLRALAVADVEEAENLGCLELDEEDLALCTYVCPSKIDHGANLRNTLTIIEKEG